MRARNVTVAIAAAAIVASAAAPAPAQNSDRYAYCQQVAYQQSGWNGSPQSGSKHAPLAGAAGGAIGGSLIGGMGGGDAGRGAAIGAAFGAVAGVARKNSAAQKQSASEQNYYNSLNACLGH